MAGWRLKFAHRTFVWDVEGIEKPAAVHRVILAFSKADDGASIYIPDRSGKLVDVLSAESINPYLVPGPPILVRKSSKVISPSLPSLKNGSVAGDTNKKLKGLPGLVMGLNDAKRIREIDPIASKFLRKFAGGEDFLKGRFRECLWIDDSAVDEAMGSPEIRARLENVRQVRLLSTESSTVKLADKPWRFKHIAQPLQSYLCMPRTVSEERDYFALGYLNPAVIVSNGSFWAVDPSGLIFSVGSSSMFMAWQLAVGGRFKSSPRFANTLVWNTFPLPDLSKEAKTQISAAGEQVISVRKEYQDLTLNQLYDRQRMPKPLRDAHRRLDRVVDNAFGLNASESDLETRQKLLFDLYDQIRK